MPRFIAIPVVQGDAFYLDREDISVLIDGGRSRNCFPSMFQAITKSGGVDVIVCTHNDADHANGILGFLEAGLKCQEVWLPGRWLSVLPDVLRPFVEVFEELADNILGADDLEYLEELQLSLSPLENYAERIHHDSNRESAAEEGPRIAEDGWPEPYLQMLEQAEPWEVDPWLLGPWHGKHWPFQPYTRYRKLEPSAIKLLWSAIDAANRIRAIAAVAFHRGIEVRWFEFKPATPSGGVPELQPINARELAKVQPRVDTLLAHLALTTANRESLVFWSPPAEDHPGVLFTADSDLGNASLPSALHRAIVTSPHHGSEANAKAYGAVSNVNGSSSVTWVRSDGRYRSRPGNSYLGVASRRLCTLCRHPKGISTRKQTVHLYARHGAWIRHHSSQLCSCQ